MRGIGNTMAQSREIMARNHRLYARSCRHEDNGRRHQYPRRPRPAPACEGGIVQRAINRLINQFRAADKNDAARASTLHEDTRNHHNEGPRFV